MAWKNLKPRSLADALIVEHAALTELYDVHALLNWSKLEAHLVSIHNKAACITLQPWFSTKFTHSCFYSIDTFCYLTAGPVEASTPNSGRAANSCAEFTPSAIVINPIELAIKQMPFKKALLPGLLSILRIIEASILM